MLSPVVLGKKKGTLVETKSASLANYKQDYR